MDALSGFTMAAFTLAIFALIFDTLQDKVQHHYKKSWFKNIKFFKPNWKNKYVKNQMGELVIDKGKYRMKLWARWLPMFIDGPHFFAFLKRLFWIGACYCFGVGGVPEGFIWFLLILWAIRKIEHFAIMHGNNKL